ncbi:MAG: DUF429 domain-containing protein [Lachnospiraceae bacterium]|nr:DUF429 domain-containing protein [Lachnospiraceae bacterium]
MVFSLDGEKILFCKRMKDPYKELYNLVGGKIEKEEDGFEAAYRELREETGIESDKIQLNHMMDFTYYNQNCYVEVYVGKISEEITLFEEAHPLKWLSADENYFDSKRFAGEGNIGHMVEQVRIYGTGQKQPERIKSSVNVICENITSIGVDGCKGGWVAAVFKQGRLEINKFNHIEDIVNRYPDFDELFIDMVIGLQSNKNHIRPDTYARQIIKERTSTIFPAPCRQAVYANTVAEAYEENERVLGKKFTPLTVGIIPKIRELDSFFQNNQKYKNVIKESHPEVCFARLNERTMLSKKSEIDGIEERFKLLARYIQELSLTKLSILAKTMKCSIDDILDAICLAVTSNIAAQGYYEVIPEIPMHDETGLLMQMVIPSFDKK